MIVAGWADGYRNNTFRTIEALAAGRRAAPAAGRSVGPHGARRRPCPGRGSTWSARWPGGGTGTCAASTTGSTTSRPATWFVRESTRPEPDLDTVDGHWRSDDWPVEQPLRRNGSRCDARPPYVVRPDIGTAAWISCAGHLPYGQSLDQRADDDRSLTWDVADGRAGRPGDRRPPGAAAAGRQLRAGGHAGGPAVRRLPRRHLGAGHPRHAEPDPARTGSTAAEPLRARASRTTWRSSSRPRRGGGCPGQRVRLAVAGRRLAEHRCAAAAADPRGRSAARWSCRCWPASRPYPPVEFAPGGDAPEGEADGVTWRIEHDVLARTTSAVIDHGGEYPTPYGGYREHYSGRVEVDRRTFAQRATARVTLRPRPAETAGPGRRPTWRCVADAEALHGPDRPGRPARPASRRMQRDLDAACSPRDLA